MQQLRHLLTKGDLPAGWGLRILLLTPDINATEGMLAQYFSDMGAIVDTETDIYAALDAVVDDPTGFGLFVMDCDPYGGFEAGRRAMLMIGGRLRPLPTILLSQDCPEQTFPGARHAPILLRLPVTKVSLRVGFEHALRDRLVFRATG